MKVKWRYPFCPDHPRTKLQTMTTLWKDGRIEFCPKGCLWGYDFAKMEWEKLKLIVA